MFKRVGILGLVLAAGMMVLQPSTATAADRHDHDGHHDRRDRHDWDRHQNRDRDRDWGRNEWRDRGRWQNRRTRDYLYFNFTPAPRYYYYTPAPSYSYPYNPYPNYGYPY